jgi:protein MAK11
VRCRNALTLSYLRSHACRVKAVDTIRVALPSTRQNSTTILSSVSSEGTVNVYDLSLLPPPAPIASNDIPEISPVVTYDSKGSRLTCVTLAEGEVDHAEQPSPEKVAKRKRESDSEAEEEEEWQGFQ